MKFSTSVVRAPSFSVSDLNIGGKPYLQASIFLKVIVWFFKKILISKEIGEFRNAIIERILNSTLDNVFSISSLIRPDMRWVEANVSKMEYIRRFTIEFVTDSEIQKIIFTTIRMTDICEQKEFMDQFIKKITTLFIIQKNEFMKSEFVKSQDEYNRFLEMYGSYLTENMEKHKLGGNLTDDLTNDKTGGKINA